MKNQEEIVPAEGDRARISTAEKKRLIRFAAFNCFSERGYHSTTVDDICAAAAISKGSFYWHYDSKQALFLDILDAWAAEVDGALANQFAAALAGAEPFAAMTTALEREARRNRRIIPIWLDSLAQLRHEPEIRAGLARFHLRIRHTLGSLLRPLLGPSLPDPDIEALAGSMMACFMGLLCQHQVDPIGASFTRQIRFFMQFLEQLVTRARLAPASPSEL